MMAKKLTSQGPLRLVAGVGGEAELLHILQPLDVGDGGLVAAVQEPRQHLLLVVHPPQLAGHHRGPQRSLGEGAVLPAVQTLRVLVFLLRSKESFTKKRRNFVSFPLPFKN